MTWDVTRFQFSLVTENYPQDQLHRNKYYNPLAVFPADLSSYLPPREDWWWEELAAKSRSGQTPQEPVIPEEDTMQEEPAALDWQVAPELAASLVPEVPASTPVSHPPAQVKNSSPQKHFLSAWEDVEMAADEPSKHHHKQKAAETAAPPKSSKHPMPALLAQSQTSESSEADKLAWEPPFDVKFEMSG
ncbi:hypothetical protein EI94DRAFT_1799528 [Lactarius quietus]|nr:hypothetical protein EI94DRAFT_1799528 [Lactarius quietus]